MAPPDKGAGELDRLGHALELIREALDLVSDEVNEIHVVSGKAPSGLEEAERTLRTAAWRLRSEVS